MNYEEGEVKDYGRTSTQNDRPTKPRVGNELVGSHLEIKVLRNEHF